MGTHLQSQEDVNLFGGDLLQYLEETGRDSLEQQREFMEKLFRVYGDGYVVFKHYRTGESITLDVVSGHLWGELTPSGPKEAEVMIIGKCLGMEEVNEGRVLVGPSGKILRKSLKQAGFPDEELDKFYVTNLLKTLQPWHSSTLRKSWVLSWKEMLFEEIRRVNPKFVLLLGPDVAKAVIGKKGKLSDFRGVIFELDEFPGVQFSVSVHPAAVCHNAELEVDLNADTRFFYNLVSSQFASKKEEFAYADSYFEMLSLIDHVYMNTDRLLGVDCEWEGDHPESKGSYLRTIQIAYQDGKAICLEFYDTAGDPNLTPNEQEKVVNRLNQLFRKYQVAGYFFFSDLEWLLDLGIDLGDFYHVGRMTWEEYARAILEDKPVGFDVGVAAHTYDETTMHSLTSDVINYLGEPAYDEELKNYNKKYLEERKLKKSDLKGFGHIPLDILGPYGCKDADAVRRLALKFRKLLMKDRYGNNCYESFYNRMLGCSGLLEINCRGVLIDRERLDRLVDLFNSFKQECLQFVREWARWEDLNLDSHFQMKELLYGDQLNGYSIVYPDKGHKRYRPKKAKCLRLTPLKSSEKYARRWEEVEGVGDQTKVSPSADQGSLLYFLRQQEAYVEYPSGRLMKEDVSDVLQAIYGYSLCKSITRNVLPPPVVDENGQPKRNFFGFYEYDKGMPSFICEDGRIRSMFFPTNETGRWNSSKPPMQNLSKSKEEQYERLLGDKYLYPIRSIVKAPDGYVLVEVDYKGAELAAMAFCSGDEQMLEDIERSYLPEDHPDHYDIHSGIACQAFSLDVRPVKSALVEAGYSFLRHIAKTIIFGVAYGRTARAIALASELSEDESLVIPIDKAEAVREAVFNRYPVLERFFQQCAERVDHPGWMCNCFGDFRRFPRNITDDAQLAHFRRQATNFPIQSTVAAAINLACWNLLDKRDDFGIDYRLVLQIHDALVFEVKEEQLAQFCHEVIPECMERGVPICPADLDGFPTGKGPYFLKTDIEAYRNWGDKKTKVELVSV